MAGAVVAWTTGYPPSAAEAIVGAGLVSRNEGKALAGAQDYRVVQRWQGTLNPFRTSCSVYSILGPLRGPFAAQGTLPQVLRRPEFSAVPVGAGLPAKRPASKDGISNSAEAYLKCPPRAGEGD